MKSFKLDVDGDVIVTPDGVAMVYDDWLIAQSVKTVLLSNKGEWWLNRRYGIDMYSMLGQKPRKDVVRENVRDGLRRIDPSFLLERCEIAFDQTTRCMHVEFEASNGEGRRIREVLTLGA